MPWVRFLCVENEFAVTSRLVVVPGAAVLWFILESHGRFTAPVHLLQQLCVIYWESGSERDATYTAGPRPTAYGSVGDGAHIMKN